jgi:uncharacterized membrane protein YhaH (DUF805 family)
MSVINTLFTVKGRASRKTFWLANLGIIGLLLTVSLCKFVVTRRPPADAQATVDLFDVLVAFAALVAVTVVLVKRLNDLVWPSWLGYAAGLLGAGIVVLQGLDFDPVNDASPISVAMPGLYTVFGPLLLLFGIVLFVLSVILPIAVLVVGLKRGTRGPNVHGPDPLSVVRPNVDDARRANATR